MVRRWLSVMLIASLVCGAIADIYRTPVEAAPPRKPLVSKKKSKTTKPAAPATKLPTGAEKTEHIELAPVDPKKRDEALKSAARIDAIIDAHLKKVGQPANAVASDHEFLRRAYLDITGTIPTAKQAAMYLAQRGESKKVVLIDQLLNRPGYASHFYNYWADILRLHDRPDNNNYGRPYADWVKECLRENVDYDSMVHEMLTAKGRIWENPAAGYYLRDSGMPLDNLNNTIRIFLGTRIGCAQCHDHPFDRWTQKEFYQLAAFTSGMEFNASRDLALKVNQKDIDSQGMPESKESREAKQILRMNRPAIWDNEKKQLKFPENYTYANAKAGDIVKPAVIFGKAPSSIPAAERREIFGDWVTSPDNPRFAMTIANRLWKRAMGVGLIEPEDDMKDDSKAVIPELLDYLASEMKRLDFDLKEFQRIVLYTKTYQRKVTYTDLPADKPYHFPGPVLRRMSAEQVWDSLLTLTMEDPDKMLRPEDSKFEEIVSLKPTATVSEVLDRAKQLDDYRKDEGKLRSKRQYKGQELLRASELPQPLPGGHFLREFGQSDRSVISTSHTDGTVPQLLAMFNGPVTHMMLEQGSVIYNEVMAKKQQADQIDSIFLSLLSRYPTEAERNIANREIKEAKAAGYGNVIWALLNTREFLFVQ